MSYIFATESHEAIRCGSISAKQHLARFYYQLSRYSQNSASIRHYPSASWTRRSTFVMLEMLSECWTLEGQSFPNRFKSTQLVYFGTTPLARRIHLTAIAVPLCLSDIADSLCPERENDHLELVLQRPSVPVTLGARGLE